MDIVWTGGRGTSSGGGKLLLDGVLQDELVLLRRLGNTPPNRLGNAPPKRTVLGAGSFAFTALDDAVDDELVHTAAGTCATNPVAVSSTAGSSPTSA